MKMIRISLISLMLGLAGVLSAAWGAESVMSLISNGEAVQKEVLDTKAAMETAQKKNKDLASEGNQIMSDQKQIAADVAAWQKRESAVRQRTADYQNQCGPKQKLNQDQFKACTALKDQLNTDIAQLNTDNVALNKRNNDLNQNRIPKYNAEIKSAPEAVKQAYAEYNAAVKKEAAWLDQARTEMASPGFTAYGKKAGCPDPNKNTKTVDAMIEMSANVIACLKKVSSS